MKSKTKLIISYDGDNSYTLCSFLDNLKREIDDDTIQKGLFGHSIKGLWGVRGFWGVKIKPTLLWKCGFNAIKEVKKRAGHIMLDAKLFETQKAIERILNDIKLGDLINLVTVHISSGFVTPTIFQNNIVGVTVLTTISEAYCNDIYKNSVINTVKLFVNKANKLGYKHVVCSGKEVEVMSIPNEIKTICPGIRLKENEINDDDQKRIITPSSAVKLGVDYRLYSSWSSYF